MNKIFKITGWVLAIIGTVFAIMSLATGGDPKVVDLLLKYTYVLFFLAVIIWIGVAVFITGKNNPKGLLKAGLFVVVAAAIVFIAYLMASGAPALNVKQQPSTSWLKLTDTLLLLTYILGGAAIVTIIYGAIRDGINK